MHPRDQTIFALSSGRPPSAIAIVRVSGPQAGPALTALAGKMPAPRTATRALLRDVGQRPIDDAVVLWFPGPASATGEDVAEFHVHGGRAVLAALFAALSAFENVRAGRARRIHPPRVRERQARSDRGRGSRRSHSRRHRSQRRQALRQLKGLLGDQARDWRARIIEASALIEAGIDFSDEGDVPAELIAPALAKIKALLAEIEEVLAAQGRSERLRDGLVVAIAGPPNVGKSTLMNQLARREVAIVSPHAGTTRDVIEVQLDLDGYPVTVIDTAGIRETDDPVEQEGVRRARARAAEADLVLWLADCSRPKVRARGRGAGLAGAQQDRPRSRQSANGRGVRAGRLCRFRPGGATGCRADRGPGRFRAGLFRRRARAGLIGRTRQRKLAAGDGGVAAAQRRGGRARARSWRRRNCAWRPILWGGCWGGSMSRTSST